MNRDNSTAEQVVRDQSKLYETGASCTGPEQVVRDQSKLYETRADLQRTAKSVCWGRDVAQLLQRRTGTPLRQV